MVSFQSKFHELPVKYVAGSMFDFENLHRDKLKSAERVFMVQLNPNDRFFLLKDNLMVIKRNNSLCR